MPTNIPRARLIWKACTFAFGLSWLIWGALFFGYPDWDIPLSLLMAFSTLVLAEWSVAVLMERRYPLWPLAAAAAWWCVDGSYWLYWSFTRPEVMIREGQWPMSLCLFLLCGFIWRLHPARVLEALRQRR